MQTGRSELAGKAPKGIVTLSHLAQKDGNFCSPGTSLSSFLDHVEARIRKKIAQIDVLVG
ncbi:hypothetical protein GCM10007874_22220 [Labrys miyagiensis]|uniref:Uncharacterized protein n=1 Tax=Labrys miyagiensis TaxID=346912 RepID=A0ABQ6CGB6_9HYPH|nr:hypothetical protein GCM10007874_22220 [Labrys miyagiensis]